MISTMKPKRKPKKGTQNIHIREVPKALWHQVKMQAPEREISIRELVINAIEESLEQYENYRGQR